MSNPRRALFGKPSPSNSHSTAMEPFDLWFGDSAEDSMNVEITSGVEATIKNLRQHYPTQLINVNCERENLFAELHTFAQEAIYHLGSICPTNSPVKSKPISLRVSQEKQAHEEIAISTSALSSTSVSIFWDNKNLNTAINDHNSRNFWMLSDKSSLLEKQLKKSSPEMFRLFVEKYRSGLNTALLEKLKHDLLKEELTIMQFLVFLKLASKYPLYSTTNILVSLKTSGNLDIYTCYKTFDNYLNQKTLTAEAVGPYLGFEEHSSNFLAPRKY